MFNEHVLTCFIDDVVGVEVRHHLYAKHIHWGVRLPPLRFDVAQLSGDGHEVPRGSVTPSQRIANA